MTIAESGVRAGQTGAGWRLALARAGAAPEVTLTRAQLLAMPQHTARLAINCVEGWSTGDQEWTGVRLRDLARLAGVGQPANVLVESLQHGGAFSRVVLSAGQASDPDSLLALRVNGADLSPTAVTPPGSSCYSSASAAVRHRGAQWPALPWINYLRVPAALSGLLLLVWFPLILRLRTRYQASTTHPPAAHSPDATPAGSPAPTPADDASHAPDPDPGTNPKK